MNRNDRIALTLIAILLIFPSILALILALSQVRKVSSSGVTILAPRTGDEVGQNFSVAGTHGTSGVTVDVTVAGPFSGSGTCSTTPDWSVSFNAGGNTGGHTANATPSSGLGGVAFKIVGDQSISLGPPTVAAGLGGASVTVAGRHNQGMAAAPPAITVRLFRPDNTLVDTVTATDNGGGNWSAVFAGVAPGVYSAQASMTVMGKTSTVSQVVRVP